jgi:hypothetical protein
VELDGELLSIHVRYTMLPEVSIQDMWYKIRLNLNFKGPYGQNLLFQDRPTPLNVFYAKVQNVFSNILSRIKSHMYTDFENASWRWPATNFKGQKTKKMAISHF